MRIPKMEIILQIPTAPKRLPKTSHIHHPIAEAGQCGNAMQAWKRRPLPSSQLDNFLAM